MSCKVEAIQLDLFESSGFFEGNDEISFLRRRVEEIDKKSDNIRRGLFSRHAKQESMIQKLIEICTSQQKDIDLLKSKLQIKAEILEFPFLDKKDSLKKKQKVISS